jgi:hypothetical protein
MHVDSFSDVRLHLRDTAVNCQSYSRVTTIICKDTSVLTMPTLMAFAKGLQQKRLREQHCLPQHYPSQPEASVPLGGSWISIGNLPSQETTTWVAALQVFIQTQKTLPFSPAFHRWQSYGEGENSRGRRTDVRSIATTMGRHKRFRPDGSLLQGASFLGLSFEALTVNHPQGA